MTEFSFVSASAHVTRQVLSHHPERMLVAFRFEAEGDGFKPRRDEFLGQI